MTWWAVSVDAEAELPPPRFLSSDDAEVRSVQLSRGRVVGLRCSVRAADGEAAVRRALVFYERRVGRPLGTVLQHRACVEGDLLSEDEGPETGGTALPRAPLPVAPTSGERVDSSSWACDAPACVTGTMHEGTSPRAGQGSRDPDATTAASGAWQDLHGGERGGAAAARSALWQLAPPPPGCTTRRSGATSRGRSADDHRL